MERRNAWKDYSEKEIQELEALNKSYREFLDQGKTERECAVLAVEMAEKAGYRDLQSCIEEGTALKPGGQSVCSQYEENSSVVPDWTAADGKRNGNPGSTH